LTNEFGADYLNQWLQIKNLSSHVRQIIQSAMGELDDYFDCLERAQAQSADQEITTLNCLWLIKARDLCRDNPLFVGFMLGISDKALIEAIGRLSIEDRAYRSIWLAVFCAKDNQDAICVLVSQLGKHPLRVFTYRGKPVTKVGTKNLRNALKRAGIENFTWHGLRHTWASWHVQSGTPLNVLQQLGGWSSYDMVLRYAHLAPDHLSDFANNVTGIVAKSVAVENVT
jgi:hypothetical protein